MPEPAVMDFLVPEDARHIVARLGRRLSLGPPESTVEEVQYLDTFDWRLWERGLVLAAQMTGDGEIRLNLTNPAGTLFRSCDASKVPAFAEDFAETLLYPQLVEILGHRRLLLRARCVRRRTSLRVLGAQGKTQVRLELIADRLLGGRRRQRQLSQPTVLRAIELRGFPEAFRRTVKILQDDLGLARLELAETPRIFSALGLVPGECSSRVRVRLTRGTTSEEAVRILLRSLWDTARLNEKGILHEIDAEFLHDYRVAIRRSRVLVGQLKEVIPRDGLDQYRGELKWLGELTGRARDLDVQLADLEKMGRRFAPSQLEDLQPVLEWFRAQRNTAYLELKAGLRSPRYRKLSRDWPRFLNRVWGTADGGRPIEMVVAARLLSLCRKLTRRGSRIPADEGDLQYHQLRILCKKLRYLLEFFRSLYATEPVRRLIKALKDLQDCLGRLNDCRVQSEMLKEFLASCPGQAGSGTPVVVGRLLEQLDRSRQDERRRFRDRFSLFADELTRLKQVVEREEAVS